MSKEQFLNGIKRELESLIGLKGNRIKAYVFFAVIFGFMAIWMLFFHRGLTHRVNGVVISTEYVHGTSDWQTAEQQNIHYMFKVNGQLYMDSAVIKRQLGWPSVLDSVRILCNPNKPFWHEIKGFK